jgi:peroxiredoxin
MPGRVERESACPGGICDHMIRLLLIMLITHLLHGTVHAEQATQPAPSFALTDMSGTILTRERLQGKVLFLAFWAPWCISCKDELPELENLYRKYRNEGLEVIGICEDADGPALSAFLKKTPVSFPLAVDPRSSVAESYRISNLPSGYLIGRDGVIRHRYRGFDKKFVQTYEKDIRELLEQHNP